MVFDLTSTQQASHDFFHPELINCSISNELKFSAALANNIEIFCYWGNSKHYIHRFCPKNFKKLYSYKLMDENEINNLVQACKLLKYKFQSVFESDNFPINPSHNSFIIVNVSTSQSIETHWALFCRRNGKYIFADPLGQT